MHRIVLVCLFVLTSFAAWVPSAAARGNDDDLPKAPQAKSDGLEFSVEGAIMGDSFGAPLNFEKDEEGRTYVVVSIRVENTSDSEKNLVSDKFAFVNGEELIGSSGSTAEQAQDALGLRAMGDSVGHDLQSGSTQVYVLGWRLSVDLDKYELNIDYDGAKRIDIGPWLDQDIDPGELVPSNVAPFRTEDGSFAIGDTLGDDADDTQFTATGYQYLDGIDLGFEVLQPRGKFVIVSFTLFVPGSTSRAFDLGDIRLYSAETNQFTEYNFEATIYYNDAGNSLTYEDLQPGITYEGNVIFDVSLEAADFWLALGGRDDEAESAIHLDSTATSGSSGGASSGSDLITDCSAFADYDEAQDYYADNADAQQYIDPDSDGEACEVFFGRS